MTEPRIPMEQGLAEALRPTAAPATLRNRLLTEAHRVDRSRRRFRSLAAAAALVAGLTGTWAILHGPADPGMDLARTAVIQHADESHLDFHGAPADTTGSCGNWCEKRLGYAATLPRSVAPSEVVGGRICKVRSHPVAYYRLACGDGLFVFGHAPEALQRARGFDLSKGHTALAWTEGERGYLRVAVGRR